ncbi:MAG: cytoplasmic protein [Desulfopila sp.]
MTHDDIIAPNQICFGLNRQLDESSIAAYLRLLGRQEMADLLSSRLADSEIEEILNLFTRILHAHLSEDEYHKIFLQDRE